LEPGITKGILPVFTSGTFGMVYSPDLARYAAIAAVAGLISNIEEINQSN
jgi:hypothetical protein